jgi:hypothetical protein
MAESVDGFAVAGPKMPFDGMRMFWGGDKRLVELPQARRSGRGSHVARAAIVLPTLTDRSPS